MQPSEKLRKYWMKNLRLTGILLTVWFVSTVGVIYFAPELNRFTFLGFPLGFYMAAQGSLIIYVLILGYYAHYMNRLDKDYDVAEGE